MKDKVPVAGALFLVAALFVGKLAMLTWSAGFGNMVEALRSMPDAQSAVVQNVLGAVLYLWFGLTVLRYNGGTVQRRCLRVAPGIVAGLFLGGLLQILMANEPLQFEAVHSQLV